MSICFEFQDSTNNTYEIKQINKFTDPINYGTMCGILYSMGINELLLLTLELFINDTNVKHLEHDIILMETDIINIKVIAENKDIIETIKTTINETELDKFEFNPSDFEMTTNIEPSQDEFNPTDFETTTNIEPTQSLLNSTILTESEEFILNEPLTNTTVKEEYENITEEILHDINEQSMGLFMDEDFRKLIKIYKTKPELFPIFNQYIQDAEVNESILSISDLNENPEYYEKLTNHIEELNLGVSRQIIYNRIVKFKGHMNLVVRSLLF